LKSGAIDFAVYDGGLPIELRTEFVQLAADLLKFAYDLGIDIEGVELHGQSRPKGN
jgi:hypothetical protein